MTSESETPALLPLPPVGARQYLVAASGLASFLLLGASFLWAHHWGPLADSIVVAWAITTLAAGIGGVRLLGNTKPAWLAGSAVAFAGISALALLTAAVSYAVGGDPTGGCGGG
ncbi:MAG: hypothetical protein ACTHNU_00915 [Gaiellales bacterium]